MNEPKWKDTFHYTQSERRGIFVLAALLFLLILLAPFVKLLHTPTKTDFTAFQQAIQEFEAAQQVEKPIPIQPFPFNPNTASAMDFIQLGLDTFLAQRIVKYRSKGGRFYQSKDLQKIYGLSTMEYERLAPYITIPKQQSKVKKEARQLLKPHPFDPNTISKKALLGMGISSKAANQWMNYLKKGGRFKQKKEVGKIYALTKLEYQQIAPYLRIPPTPPVQKVAYVSSSKGPSFYSTSSSIKIDANTAKREDWQRLTGIGPYYAKQITNFRNKLGGFVALDQIATTYGLPDSVFQKIKPHLILSTLKPSLTINIADVQSLAAHPYIQKRQAKAIVNYRKNHGAFKDWKGLKKVKVLSEEELERLKPYLDFKN